MAEPPSAVSETDVAIVGMSGRFPGADDVDQLWQRVARGDDCLTDLDPDDLVRAGVPQETVDDPSYVRRSGMLADVAGFDARLFGIGDRDAALMDPQHRHFLECAWEALEGSGNVPERFAGAIGVFAGCGMNTYLLNNIITNPNLLKDLGWFLVRHTGNDKDFLPTFVSYKLDLRGPSISVQTACSTSLVAVHLAVQSLLAFECDLAIAGGSTIDVPHGVGYHYRDGEILSPDGRCRAFDAGSQGTVLASGTGAVALRRLTDALDDGDPILAVIKGTAVNNDGSRKVGFLAPSVDGHAAVVKEALAVAGLSARDIGLLESHGTGTAVGDPIEVAALTEAFRASTPDSGFCRLVSTKPNIGHLDTAAGVASLVKAVQALRHRTLPPLANFTAPNPLLDLDRSPFVLSGTSAPWNGDRPRRAGVSSLGVGGTNAHVIVEEPPALPPTPHAAPEQVLCLSAQVPEAVTAARVRLADALRAAPDSNLADVAHTLFAGRRAMPRRRVVVARDTESAVDVLQGGDTRRSFEAAAADSPSLVFLFPGGGSQYPGMGAGLDDRFEVYHRTLRDGIEVVTRLDGPDLTPLLAPDGDEDALRRAEASLPAVFVVSVALARQWMHWGARPDAFAGHSLGEYVAAHLAGVLTFDDALTLVVTRSRLMAQSTAGGAMLVVSLAEGELRAVLPDDLSLAVVNAADECVVAGTAAAIDRFADQLTADDVPNRLIPLSAAAHSHLLDPVLEEFGAAVRSVRLSAPTGRYVSNLTGTWITAAQATDPQYWVDHLRNTVRFDDCLDTVLADGPTVVVELGPGQTLSSYARRQAQPPVGAVPSLRHVNDDTSDTAFTLLAFAKLWALGVPVDVGQLAGAGRRRLRLPTYPFQHTTYWIEPGSGFAAAPVRSLASTTPTAPQLQRIDDVDQWFWQQDWARRDPQPAVTTSGNWLLLAAEGSGLTEALAGALRSAGATVTVAIEEAAPLAVDALHGVDGVAIIAPAAADLLGVDAAADRWLSRALDIVRSLGNLPKPVRFAAITSSAVPVGTQADRPVDALALGPVLVAPREYPNVSTVLVDIDGRSDAALGAVASDLVGSDDQLIAYRNGDRFVAELRHQPLGTGGPAIRAGDTYVVTGALGEVGSVLAGHLASAYRANLIVVSSTPLPEPSERQRWVQTHGVDEPTSRRIRRLEELERHGTKVAVVTADLADPAAVHAALAEGEQLAGPIDGVVHAAGVLHDGLIELSDWADHRAVVGPKAGGAATLLDALNQRDRGVLCLVGSTSTLLGAPGQVAYVSANSYLDSLAGQRGRVRVVTIDFGAFAGEGMAAEAASRQRLGIAAGKPVQHPVLTSIHHEADGSIGVLGRLDPTWHWVVDEHRTSNGAAVLPGTGHLELMLAALGEAELPMALADVALLAPVVVPDDRTVRMKVTIAAPSTDGTRALRLESDGGFGRRWQIHSRATATDASVTRSIDLRTLPATAEPARDPLAAQRRHLRLGERWDAISGFGALDGRAVGAIEVPGSDADAWVAHPAAVDLATAVALTVFDAEPGRLHVPVGYDRVLHHSALPERVLAIAERSASSGDGVVRADIVLVDAETGAAALRIDGLALRAVDAAGFAEVSAAVPAPDAATDPYVALAEGLGIRPAEAALVFERAWASGDARVIASSVSVDELRAATAPPVEEPATCVGIAAHGGGVLGVLTQIWEDLLGVSNIATDADFFELGGHSLIAIRVMSRIQRDLGVKLPLATLFQAPTLQSLSELAIASGAVAPEVDGDLTSDGDARTTTHTPARRPAVVTMEHRSVVPLREVGDRTPLFIAHGAGGNVLFLSGLVRAMDPVRPVYGLQALGIDSHDFPDTTIEQMAARYVGEIRSTRPGPYILGGYSGGGLVGLEMARQLQALGEEVRAVVLFDSVPPGKSEPGTFEAWRNVARHLLTAGFSPVRPFLRERARQWKHRMTPWKGPIESAAHVEFGFNDVGELGFVDLYHYFTATAEKYRLARYDVDVVLFKADDVWPTQPKDYFWTPYINGRLILASSPGDHHSMFLPECAPTLAARLQHILESFDN